MGYCITSRDCKFVIKRANMDLALAALKKAIKKAKRWDWVGEREISDAKSLSEAMNALMWPLGFKDVPDDGMLDATSIYFNGEKMGSEDEFFAALAPYVEEGSWIEATGEDDDRWRWVFRNKKMTVESAIISWENYEAVVRSILDRMEKANSLPLLLRIHPVLDRMLEERLKAPKKKRR